MRWMLQMLMLSALAHSTDAAPVIGRRTIFGSQQIAIAPCSSSITNNMLAWFKLDETTGNRVDSLGTTPVLTPSASVTYTNGIKGNAAVMPAGHTLSTLAVNAGNWNPNSSDYSIAVFIKNPPAATVMEMTDGILNWKLDAGPSGFSFTIGDGMGGMITVTTNTVVGSSWHLVAFGFDAASSEIWISVDAGGKARSSYMSFSPDVITRDFYIRQSTVDEISIVRRVYSDEEIACIWNNGLGRTWNGTHVQ